MALFMYYDCCLCIGFFSAKAQSLQPDVINRDIGGLDGSGTLPVNYHCNYACISEDLADRILLWELINDL